MILAQLLPWHNMENTKINFSFMSYVTIKGRQIKHHGESSNFNKN
jgi:hypothetical protein